MATDTPPALPGKGAKPSVNIGSASTSSLDNIAKLAGLTPEDLAQARALAGGKSSTVSKPKLPYATESGYSLERLQSLVADTISKLYHRSATPEEIVNWANKLKKEQDKATFASKTRYENINGLRTAITETPTTVTQWLTDKLAGTKEYKDIQKNLNSINAQNVKSIVEANGLSKVVSDKQIADWSNRLANGESLDTIKSAVRTLAATGQPDTVKNLLNQGTDLESIYAPYKQAMANVLEINPATITLDDPTLRSAITPQGEMSLYDYQRALRNDPRWQYTNNAKQDVSNAVTKVLQDFGFMG